MTAEQADQIIFNTSLTWQMLDHLVKWCAAFAMFACTLLFVVIVGLFARWKG